MHIVKRAFWTAFWVLLRVDFGENSIFWAGADTGQDASGVNRDVRFINTQKRDTYLLGLIQTENTRPMVYRNEDTGWGWPPYFKLDSSNLQTDVADLKSTSSEPQWAVLTHYGWRNELLSMRPIEDPTQRLIPWFNAVILIILAGLMLGFYRLTQWFRREKIDPIVDSAQDTWDGVDAYADQQRAGLRGWLDSWKSKPKR